MRIYENLDEYWLGQDADRKVDIIRKAMKHYGTNGHGYTRQKFINLIRKVVAADAAVLRIDIDHMVPSATTITRIVTEDETSPNAPADNAQRAAILLTLAHVDGFLAQDFKDNPDWKSAMSLAVDLREFIEESVPSTQDPVDKPEVSKGPSDQQDLAAAQGLSRALEYAHSRGYLKVKPTTLFDIGEVFAPYIDRERADGLIEKEAYFLCYRYSTKPGFIVKSFTVVRPPSDHSPLGTFSNFYDPSDGNNPSRTDGVVLGFNNTIYLLGEVDEGAALKVVAFPRIRPKQKIFTGMLSTQRSSSQLVASKMVFNRTELFETSQQAKIGEFAADHISDEIRPFADKLRNRVPFNLEDDLSVGAGDNDETISQNAMVAMTEQLTKGKMFIGPTDSRRPFNPAADHEYTYNSALVLDE